MNTRLAAFVVGSLTLASLSGCYKADMEKAQAQAKELQTQLDAEKAKVSAAEEKARRAEVAVNTLNALRQGNAVVMTYGWQNGQWAVQGQDNFRYTEQGQFVRHGARVRETGRISFNNGMLADQTFTINRAGTQTKYVEGTVKGGKADGEWMWYDRNGKLTNVETWREGTLDKVESVATDKAGKQTRKKLGTADTKKWYNDRVAVFVNIPELLRNAPGTAAPSATSAGGAATAPRRN